MGAEDFDKMQAYKIANGQVNSNPLVDKDGMINLAMDYESDADSEGTVFHKLYSTNALNYCIIL